MNGVVNVRKEKGITSFGVVAALRKIYGIRKIGHAGTLDPDAEGVLPVCIGRATRLVEEISRGTKEYAAVMTLGVSTDTQDMGGAVLSSRPVTADEGAVREAVLSFSGEQMQIPPMYSAVKIGGRKLVDLARKGIEVERKPRPVNIINIEVTDISLPDVSFKVECSHGTYVRTLCNDIGEKLGCGGAMKSLVRTRVGEFRIEDAMTLDEIRNAVDLGYVRRIDSFFGQLPEVYAGDAALKGIVSGNPVRISDLVRGSDVREGKEARLYTADGTFAGIYVRSGDQMRLVKYFYEGDQ